MSRITTVISTSDTPLYDMGIGFLQTEGTEDDWEQLIDDIAEILAGKTE